MMNDSAPTFNWSRWGFLGILAMTFASFTPLSILTPVPLIAACLLFGRKQGLLLGLAATAILGLAAVKINVLVLPAGVIFLSLIYGGFISEIIFRNVHPVKGLILSGFTIVMLLGFFLGIMFLVTDVSIPKEIDSIVAMANESFKIQTESQRLALEEQIAYIKQLWGAISFISVFLWLWISLFIVLRNSHLWRKKVEYSYYISDLVRFKVPDFFIYLLILFLGIALGGKYLFGQMGETIGFNLLYCLGVFYFFHGVGIFLDLLTFLRIFRFMKMVILFFTIMLEPRIFFGIGVFDLWINFRRFFKNKTN